MKINNHQQFLKICCNFTSNNLNWSATPEPEFDRESSSDIITLVWKLSLSLQQDEFSADCPQQSELAGPPPQQPGELGEGKWLVEWEGDRLIADSEELGPAVFSEGHKVCLSSPNWGIGYFYWRILMKLGMFVKSNRWKQLNIYRSKICNEIGIL